MKRPSFQFYPADWRKDPGVQALPYHDRGVWFEIICLLHESEERGKLLLNGRPMPDDALARLLGLDKQKLNQTLSILIEFGVAQRCEQTGALMNRRMVRDEALSKIRAESGKKGGNPVLLNQNPTPSSSSSSSASEEVEERERRARRPTLDQAKTAAANMGVSAEKADEWWHAREASEWIKGMAGGGTAPVGTNWQADLKTYASRSGIGTNGHKPDHRKEKAATEYPQPKRTALPRL